MTRCDARWLWICGYHGNWLERSPSGYNDQPQLLQDIDPLPSTILDDSFEQVTLEPGELTHIESRAEDRLVGWYPETSATVRMAMGELDAIPTGPQSGIRVSSGMYFYFPGPQTFFNTGDIPATLTFMRIAPPADPVPATPVAPESGNSTPVASPVVQVQPHETLLDIQVVPADLNANPLSNWDSMEFALVHVQTRARASAPTIPYFACCIGIATFQVLEGSASFIVECDADVYAAGGVNADPDASGNALFARSGGDSGICNGNSRLS